MAVKQLAVIFLFLSTTVYATENAYIISGFDDVLRQAENTGLIKAALKILEEDKGFAGMPELYQTISIKEDIPQFTLVSAISSLFDKRIDRFLSNSQFPSNRRYLRNWLTEWSIESFKIQKIKEILREKPNRKFIVIFDNSDASLRLTAEINRQFSGQIVAIYLRMVVNKNLPKNSNGFYTAFDIAKKEYELGRLSPEDVTKVGQAILNETDVSSIIPYYSQCLIQHEPCGIKHIELEEVCEKVTQHIRMLCRH